MINTLYHPCAAGGAQETVKLLAEGLTAAGHDVTVFAISERHEEERYTLQGVNVIKVPIANIYNPYSTGQFKKHSLPKRIVWHLKDAYSGTMANRLKAYPEFSQADVVSTHNLAGFSSAVWAAAAQLRIPLLAVLHDYYTLCVKSTTYSAKKRASCTRSCIQCRLARRSARTLSSNVAVVIGVSKFMLQKHLSWGCFRNAEPLVNYNACEPLHLDSSGEAKHGLRFGFVGTISPEKGVAVLLQSFQRLRREDCELHIFGNGDNRYMERLRAAFGEKRIVWHGRQKPEDIYRAIDVLVVPSLWEEPFGRVAIEALVHGIPVLGARRGGLIEILADDGYSMLFDPTSVEELLDGLERFADMDEGALDRMRSAARVRGKEFSTARNYDVYFSAIRRAYALASTEGVG